MRKQIYTVGGKEVTAYIPKTTNVYNLKCLYDVCNDLFADYSECFYTSSAVNTLRKDKGNVFLRKE